MSGFVADYGPPSSGLSGQVGLGTNQATAYLVTKRNTIFASVPSGTGAVLPSSYAPGVSITIGNRDASNSLMLYPGPGDQIEANGVDVGVPIAIGANFTFVSFDPPLSAKPRTWWQTETYAAGGYLPLTGGTISGSLIVSGTLTGNGTVVLSPANKDVTISPTGTGKAVIAPATAGSVNNMTLGQSTPLAATVTTLTTTSTVALSPANKDVTISPTGTGKAVIAPATAGTLDNLVIGGSTPLALTATLLTATSSVALSPANKNVVISPTGTGLVTINPATAGSLDNVSIGQTTPLAVKATTLVATGAVTLSPAAGVVAISPTSLGAINNVTVGLTTAAASKFTTISASGLITPTYPAGIKGNAGGSATAPQAGSIGEPGSVLTGNATSVVTITIASPGVITWAAHGLAGNSALQFTTSGSLPTGLVAGTVYYVVGSSITTNTFNVATTIVNAIAGTAINTSGTQAGTQTAFACAPLASGVPINVNGLSLTAGDWLVWGTVSFSLAGGTTISVIEGWVSTTSVTAPTFPNSGAITCLTATLSAGGVQSIPTGMLRLPISSTTVIYLGAAALFGVSVMNAYGFMQAVRL